MSLNFRWDIEKNRLLIKERKISFEEALFYIENNAILDIVENENYKNQKVFILEINNYAYLVPFVENKNEVFLKTIIPSRVATKKYLREKQYE